VHNKKASLIKLDVKFNLPIYDGELNTEKLDNWIRQIDVYCRVQNIDSEKRKFSWQAYAYEALPWFGGKAEPKLT